MPNIDFKKLKNNQSILFVPYESESLYLMYNLIEGLKYNASLEAVIYLGTKRKAKKKKTHY